MVDDHPANLVALEAVLEPLGQRLVKATSGEEALRRVLAEDFALILLDVQMPGLDGFETARLIKARERTRHIPLVFLTALHRDETYVLRGYAQGAVDYVVKPFAPDLLRAKVGALLAQSRSVEGRWRREAERRLRAEEERSAAARRAEAERRLLQERDQALAHQNRLTQTIIDNVTSALFVMDDQGRPTFMNPAAERMTGFRLEDIAGAPLHDAIHHHRLDGTPLPREECAIGHAFDRCEPVRDHADTFLRRDGSFFPVRCAMALLERDGRLVGAVLEVRDVTEHERAEQATAFLAEASQVLASSLEVEELLQQVARLAVPRVADGCSVELLEADGVIRRAAMELRQEEHLPRARALDARCPMRLEDAVGHGRVIREGEPVWNPEVTDAFLEQQSPDAGFLEQVRALGVRSYIIAPMQARGRTVGSLTLSMMDSGRRLTAEDVPLAVDLARRVGLAVDNALLYREAREAIRLRDEFLSVASHELKTPLTPLALRLQGLQRDLEARPDGPLEPRVVASVDAARRQVKRLSDLVSGLLDVSRITAGKLKLELEPVDLAGLVREVVGRFREEALRAGCELRVRAEAPVEGRWDRMRLEQVVTNLLSNALKYGAGRPVEVVVLAGEGRARLVVCDEGIGISPEDLSRIFGRFERAVSDRHYGGLGLGLYICRQIAEALGGQVAAVSQPGAGATFTVELPQSGPPAAEGSQHVRSHGR